MSFGSFSKIFRNQRGITLLEIVIVVVLLALFVTIALPRIQSQMQLHLKKQARMLSGTIQFLYNQAVMKNRTFRLHYDLDEKQYWVESSTEKIELTASSTERRAFREKLKKPRTKFQLDKSLLKKKITLRKGIKFKDINTEARQISISSGDAYTHFFPHGYVEETTIRLESKEGDIYSIVVNPLTGGAKVYDYDIESR